VRDRGLRHWLAGYLLDSVGRSRRRRVRGTRHVLLLTCDHFEPRHGATRDGQDRERVARWSEEYPRFRDRCRSAFGHAPLHTWFYPPHHGLEHLETLSRWAFEGHGEVELHYHHGSDTSASLRRGLDETLAAYARRGLLLRPGAPPRTSFAFVHGDWALDNSGQARHCGVNDELTILQELGCWGDFTMPSANECQTRQINSIYYATDDPERPKSHDRGVHAQVGRESPGLFLMQGPLGINWGGPRYPRLENASLTTPNWGRPDRIGAWLDCHVHVRGRPEWIFVKLHAHGAVERDHDALFGERAFEMHRWLNEKVNDGERFRLHYVTARQAYNVARAAESGASGDPSGHMDFELPPYASSRYWLDAEHDLQECTEERLALSHVSRAGERRLRLASDEVLKEVRGPLGGLVYDRRAGVLQLDLAAPGRVEIDTAHAARLEPLDGADASGAHGDGGRWSWVASEARHLRLRMTPS
jgi:hypothetical protein